MKCAFICLMALCAFETVFADLRSDFLLQVKFITSIVDRDINYRAKVASGKKINFGDCKDIATFSLQESVFQCTKKGSACIDDKTQKDKTACTQKAISDLQKGVKRIGPTLQGCIDVCAKIKTCVDD